MLRPDGGAYPERHDDRPRETRRTKEDAPRGGAPALARGRFMLEDVYVASRLQHGACPSSRRSASDQPKSYTTNRRTYGFTHFSMNSTCNGCS
jgi:hypothetical protein